MVTWNMNAKIIVSRAEFFLSVQKDYLTLQTYWILHGPSMLAVKAKIYGVLHKQHSSIAFDETSSYWSALKSS